MADEIRQTLGFDASGALNNLNALQTALARFSNELLSVNSALTSFNSGANAIQNDLRAIARTAQTAIDTLKTLAAVKVPQRIINVGGGSGGNQAQSSGGLTGQAAAQAMNQLLSQTPGLANRAGAAVTNAGNNAANSLNNARRSGNGFAVSLETITRVIATQTIVRALNLIRSAIEDSFGEFLKFSKAISEIQTISGDKSTFGSITAEVRGLSDAFNSPLLDVARAKYQVLSNGFEDAKDQALILDSALKFSKIGISDVTGAADLLTSSLNAYGRGAEEAAGFSAKLFETVRLGRVVGKDLVTAFARVAPIASQIGASSDEVLAGFSSITIGGTNASEAATQLRATLVSLLKPSKDMSAAFRALGVENGEQIIQAYGFQGALKALIGTTDGTKNAIAKLFPNFRALSGVFRETGNGAEVFQDHLGKIQRASEGLLNEKFDIFINTNAAKVEADLNKLKNFFTLDFGEKLVGAVQRFFELTGGVQTTIDVIKNFTFVVAFAAGAIGTYITVMGIARAAHAAFAASAATTAAAQVAVTTTTGTATVAITQQATALKGASLAAGAFRGALLGITLAFAADAVGSFIGDSILRAANEAREKAAGEQAKFLQQRKEQTAVIAQIDKSETDKQFQELNKQVAQSEALYFKRVDAAKAASEAELSDAKSLFARITQAAQRHYNDERNAAKNAAKVAIDSRKVASDIQGTLDDRLFERQNRHFSDTQKARVNADRASTLASEAAAQLSNAKTPAALENANDKFSRAKQFADEAVQLAKASGNSTALRNAEQGVDDVLKKQAQSRLNLASLQDKDVVRAQQAAAEDARRIDLLKRTAKEFLTLSNPFDKKGAPKTPAQLKADGPAAQKAFDDFFKLATAGGGKFDISDLLQFKTLQSRIRENISQADIEKLQAKPAALTALRNQVVGSLSDLEVGFKNAGVDTSKFGNLSALEQFAAARGQLADQKAELDQLAEKAVHRGNLEREILAAQVNQKNILREQQGILEGTLTLIGKTVDVAFTKDPAKLAKTQQDTANITNRVAGIVKNPAGTTEQDLNQIFAQIQEIESRGLVGPLPELERAARVLLELKKQINAQDEIRGQGGDVNKNLDKANQRLNQTDPLLRKQAQAVQSQTELSTQSSNAENATFGIATALDEAIAKAQALESVMASVASVAGGIGFGAGQVQTAAHGGLMRGYAKGGPVHNISYFASGGHAKGTDTIPAMLSPGEFVVNSRSTSKFFSQLQAINAGVEPSAPERGGGSTTINLGGFTVNGAQSPQLVAREVIGVIRREQRRGSGNSLR